jgi:hypothetical protein
MSGISELQLAYWQKLSDYLRASDSPSQIKSPRPSHYTYIPIGRSGIFLSAAMNTKTNIVSVNLILQGQDAKNQLELLYQDKDLIEAEVGYPLEWHSSSKDQQTYISIYRSCDPTDQSQWPIQHAWLKGRLETLSHSRDINPLNQFKPTHP